MYNRERLEALFDFFICSDTGKVVKGGKGDRPYLNCPPVAVRGDDKFICNACGATHTKRALVRASIDMYLEGHKD
jgi:hypothetical protein